LFAGLSFDSGGFVVALVVVWRLWRFGVLVLVFLTISVVNMVLVLVWLWFWCWCWYGYGYGVGMVMVLVLPSRIWCWCGFGVAHWCFSLLFAARVVLFRGTTSGWSRSMMELFVLGVNTSLQSAATLALYAAAFVMLVLV
jgi:hypothetical protein